MDTSMIRIKFRAWSHTANRFVSAPPHLTPHIDQGYPTFEVDSRNDTEPLDVTQYSGLQDINGRDIYDGDILIAHMRRDLSNFIPKPDIAETYQTAPYECRRLFVGQFIFHMVGDETINRVPPDIFEGWEIVGNRFEALKPGEAS